MPPPSAQGLGVMPTPSVPRVPALLWGRGEKEAAAGLHLLRCSPLTLVLHLAWHVSAGGDKRCGKYSLPKNIIYRQHNVPRITHSRSYLWHTPHYPGFLLCASFPFLFVFYLLIQTGETFAAYL